MKNNKLLKTIQIKTITPAYDKVEDRIRLSINYQDVSDRIDLMITRSFILQLIPVIEEYIYKYYPDFLNEEGVIHIEADKIESNKNITSTTTIEDIYLYESLQDLLITINLKYDATNKFTHLEFISKDNYKVVSVCDFNMLQNIIESIKSVIPNFSWGISAHL